MKSVLLSKCINYYYRLKREKWLKHIRKENKNHEFCLIANDCIGGVLCHDLGEQFRSPMVNVGVPNDCYLDLMKNLEYYFSCDVIEIPDESKPYPVGMIIPRDDQHIPIRLDFVHDKSFQEAYAKWSKRLPRVNYDHLYFIWHYYDDEDNIDKLKEFDNWEARKLAIIHNPINGIHCCSVVDCYNENPYSGKILEIINRTGKRYLDDVNYLDFLNGKGK